MALEVESAFDYLKKSVSSERLSHAYLITGQQGSGKEELVLKIISLVNDTSDKGSLQKMGNNHTRGSTTYEPSSPSRVSSPAPGRRPYSAFRLPLCLTAS